MQTRAPMPTTMSVPAALQTTWNTPKSVLGTPMVHVSGGDASSVLVRINSPTGNQTSAAEAYCAWLPSTSECVDNMDVQWTVDEEGASPDIGSQPVLFEMDVQDSELVAELRVDTLGRVQPQPAAVGTHTPSARPQGPANPSPPVEWGCDDVVHMDVGCLNDRADNTTLWAGLQLEIPNQQVPQERSGVLRPVSASAGADMAAKRTALCQQLLDRAMAATAQDGSDKTELHTMMLAVQTLMAQHGHEQVDAAAVMSAVADTTLTHVLNRSTPPPTITTQHARKRAFVALIHWAHQTNIAATSSGSSHVKSLAAVSWAGDGRSVQLLSRPQTADAGEQSLNVICKLVT